MLVSNLTILHADKTTHRITRQGLEDWVNNDSRHYRSISLSIRSKENVAEFDANGIVSIIMVSKWGWQIFFKFTLHQKFFYLSYSDLETNGYRDDAGSKERQLAFQLDPFFLPKISLPTCKISKSITEAISQAMGIGR